jgi:hypothetical protein
LSKKRAIFRKFVHFAKAVFWGTVEKSFPQACSRISLRVVEKAVENVQNLVKQGFFAGKKRGEGGKVVFYPWGKVGKLCGKLGRSVVKSFLKKT